MPLGRDTIGFEIQLQTDESLQKIMSTVRLNLFEIAPSGVSWGHTKFAARSSLEGHGPAVSADVLRGICSAPAGGQHGRHASCHVIRIGQVMHAALPAEQMCGARLTARETIPTHPQ